MKLSDKINNQTIILPLSSKCKNEVMHELLDHFYKMNYLTSTVKLFSYLDNQDKEFNSASGRGVAYHYHTSIEINDTLAVLGISKKGIDYSASDGLLCHFILLVLEPNNAPNVHRKYIRLFQDMIKDINVKERLLKSDSSLDVEKTIKIWEEKTINNII